eukprot:jgi/Astpho2/1413/e_gw1.00025.68.1_t
MRLHVALASAYASCAHTVCLQQNHGRIIVVGTARTSPGVRLLVKSVVRGLRAHQQPEASTEGLGGTYFFLNEAGSKASHPLPVAIMKPCDEEPLAPNNPKGYVGRQLGEPGLKPTVRVGEAAMREVAAYLLDHDRFAHVPHTVLCKVTHPCFHMAPTPCAELGSLQEFVTSEGDCSDFGTSSFSVKDVHSIGILDLRLFNCDRHAGQQTRALARLQERQVELLPIDHGFCLPEAPESPYFEWLYWPQAMIPFDEGELAYIASLDAARDVALLKQELPALRVESLRILEVSTVLLKRGAAAGLSLAEIATIVTRPSVSVLLWLC